ncbi:MAG: hypothetical protein U1D30_11105 [Planctomycetota bacterium]
MVVRLVAFLLLAVALAAGVLGYTYYQEKNAIAFVPGEHLRPTRLFGG